MLLPPDVSADELLSYVRPLYPNGIFPLGTGWRIVAGVAAALFLLRFSRRFTPRGKQRREAFAVFDASERSFAESGNVSALASELSVLMRRVALSRFGRGKTAGLNGMEWTDFLESTGADLNEQDKTLLSFQAYAPPLTSSEASDGRHLLAVVREWLEHNL